MLKVTITDPFIASKQSISSNHIAIHINDVQNQLNDKQQSALQDDYSSSGNTCELKPCKSSIVTKEDGSNSIEALQNQLRGSSQQLVKEGEKNISLALDLVKVRDNLKLVQKENKELRHALLEGINVSMSYQVKDFMNIPVLELLRIRMQEFKDDKTGNPIVSSSTYGARKLDSFFPGTKLEKGEENTNEETSEHNVSKKDELERLKVKVAKMMDTTRRERELKSKLERDISLANQRIEALSDHIEKLMIHLKHEAISKAKTLNDCTRCRKEIELLKKRNETMEKRNNRKNRAINELKDGAKILEDQLTLMDEKFMDLRMKLDWTRTQTERVINKKEEEIKDLRAKLLLTKQDIIAFRGKKKVRK